MLLLLWSVVRIVVAGTIEPNIIFEIKKARVDINTKYLVATLEISTADNRTIMFNTYDPQYYIKINGGEYESLGVTRWRHPFGVRDIKSLSKTNTWIRGYFYKINNILPTSIKKVQFMIKGNRSADTTILEWIKQENITDKKEYTNLWYGIAETQEYLLSKKERGIKINEPKNKF